MQNKRSTTRSLATILTIIGCFATSAHKTYAQTSPTEQANEAPALAAKISTHAISPITEKSYPKTFRKWGAQNIKKVNNLLRPAALVAAKSDTCDKIDYVDLSDSRSTPPDTIVFFVDCLNNQRFYISEQDIINNKTAISKQEKTDTISDHDAIKSCIKAVRASLQFPSSLNRELLSTQVYRSPYGNISVTFDFEAQNGLGNLIPQKARCVIDDTGLNPPEISDR